MAEENKLKLVKSIIKSIVGIILPFILVWTLLSHNPTSLNINTNVVILQATHQTATEVRGTLLFLRLGVRG